MGNSLSNQISILQLAKRKIKKRDFDSCEVLLRENFSAVLDSEDLFTSMSVCLWAKNKWVDLLDLTKKYESKNEQAPVIILYRSIALCNLEKIDSARMDIDSIDIEALSISNIEVLILLYCQFLDRERDAFEIGLKHLEELSLSTLQFLFKYAVSVDEGGYALALSKRILRSSPPARCSDY